MGFIWVAYRDITMFSLWLKNENNNYLQNYTSEWEKFLYLLLHYKAKFAYDDMRDTLHFDLWFKKSLGLEESNHLGQEVSKKKLIPIVEFVNQIFM